MTTLNKSGGGAEGVRVVGGAGGLEREGGADPTPECGEQSFRLYEAVCQGGVGLARATWPGVRL